jgi:hypothetical protein
MTLLLTIGLFSTTLPKYCQHEQDGHLAWDLMINEFDVHISMLARGLAGLCMKKGNQVGLVMGH